ncbi:leucine-rich repeat-containing protein 4C-like [Branchiostoma floridae x Branchiostoma japonicum]
MNVVTRMLYVLCIITPVLVVVVESESCPKGCTCTLMYQHTYCGDQSLKEVPPGISDKTKILILNRNNLTRLNPNALPDLPNLNTLDLTDNSLKVIEDGAFNGVSNLETLELYHNRLTAVPSSAFKPLKNLQELGLGANPIVCLDSYAFSYLSSLRMLELKDLKALRGVSKNAFYGLAGLVYLSMVSSNLRTVPYLQHLTGLEELDLSRNSITVLTAENFESLPKLKRLLLTSNQLTGVEQDSFDDLKALTDVNLSYNNLTRLPYGLFGKMTSLQEFDLRGNLWNCSCEVMWLVQWMRGNMRSDTRELCGKCVNPKSERGKFLCDIVPEEINCSVPRIAKPVDTVNVSVGDSAALKCKAGQETAISWITPNGTTIRHGSFRVKVKVYNDGTNTLNITRVTLTDAGVYRCVAKNTVGSDSYATILNVTGSVLPTYIATEVPVLEEPAQTEDTFDASICVVQQDNKSSTSSAPQSKANTTFPPTVDIRIRPKGPTIRLDPPQNPITFAPDPSDDSSSDDSNSSKVIDHKTYVIASIAGVVGLGFIIWIIFLIVAKCPRKRNRDHKPKPHQSMFAKRTGKKRKKKKVSFQTSESRMSCLRQPEKEEVITEIPEVFSVSSNCNGIVPGITPYENMTLNPASETIV